MNQVVLTESEIKALAEAVDDEYKAIVTYEQVMEDFGPVRPFVNIIEAERRHVQALQGLYDRYELVMPASTWQGRAPRFASRLDACLAGIEGEVENVEMYDRLLAAASQRDVREVFERLQGASRDRHLPAFLRCVEQYETGSERRGDQHQERRRGRGRI